MSIKLPKLKNIFKCLKFYILPIDRYPLEIGFPKLLCYDRFTDNVKKEVPTFLKNIWNNLMYLRYIKIGFTRECLTHC